MTSSISNMTSSISNMASPISSTRTLSEMSYNEQLEFLDCMLKQIDPGYAPPQATRPLNPLFAPSLASPDDIQANILSYENRKRRMSGSVRNSRKTSSVSRSNSCSSKSSSFKTHSMRDSNPEIKRLVECGKCGTHQTVTSRASNSQESCSENQSDKSLVRQESELSDDVFTDLRNSDIHFGASSEGVTSSNLEEGLEAVECYSNAGENVENCNGKETSVQFEDSSSTNNKKGISIQFEDTSLTHNKNVTSIQFEDTSSTYNKNVTSPIQCEATSSTHDKKVTSIQSRASRVRIIPTIAEDKSRAKKHRRRCIKKHISSKIRSLFKKKSLYCKISKSPLAENEYDVIRDHVTSKNDHVSRKHDRLSSIQDHVSSNQDHASTKTGQVTDCHSAASNGTQQVVVSTSFICTSEMDEVLTDVGKLNIDKAQNFRESVAQTDGNDSMDRHLTLVGHELRRSADTYNSHLVCGCCVTPIGTKASIHLDNTNFMYHQKCFVCKHCDVALLDRATLLYNVFVVDGCPYCDVCIKKMNMIRLGKVKKRPLKTTV